MLSGQAGESVVSARSSRFSIGQQGQVNEQEAYMNNNEIMRVLVVGHCLCAESANCNQLDDNVESDR